MVCCSIFRESHMVVRWLTLRTRVETGAIRKGHDSRARDDCAQIMLRETILLHCTAQLPGVRGSFSPHLHKLCSSSVSRREMIYEAWFFAYLGRFWFAFRYMWNLFAGYGRHNLMQSCQLGLPKGWVQKSRERKEKKNFVIRTINNKFWKQRSETESSFGEIFEVAAEAVLKYWRIFGLN